MVVTKLRFGLDISVNFVQYVAVFLKKSSNL